jgi:hypothetical protein
MNIRKHGSGNIIAVLMLGLFLQAPMASAGSAWTCLFNGLDLSNWVQHGTARWRVVDGVIHGGQEGDPKRSGLLATRQEFQDFELELEFKIDEHGKYNSGVYLRNSPGAGSRTGYQVNIGRAAAQEYIGIHTDRWLAKGDEDDSIRRKLEWNHLYIFAKGPHIKVRLNGIEIVDFIDPAPLEKLLQPGVIAFQTYGAEGHAGWLKFRNIRIRELQTER